MENRIYPCLSPCSHTFATHTAAMFIAHAASSQTIASFTFPPFSRTLRRVSCVW
nr:MAG TPA: hypothetical protein [Caudoviricetes sp.]